MSLYFIFSIFLLAAQLLSLYWRDKRKQVNMKNLEAGDIGQIK